METTRMTRNRRFKNIPQLASSRAKRREREEGERVPPFTQEDFWKKECLRRLLPNCRDPRGSSSSPAPTTAISYRPPAAAPCTSQFPYSFYINLPRPLPSLPCSARPIGHRPLFRSRWPPLTSPNYLFLLLQPSLFRPPTRMDLEITVGPVAASPVSIHWVSPNHESVELETEPILGSWIR